MLNTNSPSEGPCETLDIGNPPPLTHCQLVTVGVICCAIALSLCFMYLFALDDEVYMPDKTALEEYVLNDHGMLFQGSANSITPMRWYFGQVFTKSFSF